ncbi:Zinc finger, CCHC-type [Rhizoctonia solani]|uniref:Zinc finger, CCHC-type n=1 Tax=Rhizoctonia solani TaxID=456999 RepID=A0A8H8NKV9_9AGAM|nr:Zinc finger, CCHC-type [Rhizoctonia solani]QRW15616.1 Zinc finger, CCHC-type [Rhizoctonia solani]
MSFDHMSDQELLNMVAQNMIVLKKEFSQLQGAYEAQHDQIALLRAELEEHRDQSRNQHIFYSNQIQGAAASIQAVQDQLLHQSSSCSTAPLPPPPPSGTATTINPPPTSSNSDLKFAKPNKFSGKKEDALNFIIACQAYIRAKGANRSQEKKFLSPKWNNLRQKASVQEYTREFQQYSVSLGYSDETLRDKYYDGLKNEIKDIMLSTMFQWRCATAQQVYDKAEEIANHIESTRLSNPSVSTVCATTAVSTSTPNPTPACTCLNVGDNVYMIDPTTRRAKKGAITSIVRTTSGNMPNIRWNGETKDTMIPFPSLKKDKRPAAAAPVRPTIAPTPVLASSSKGPGPMDLDGRGFANLICHICGGKGHFAQNCPSKPMSGHVANVEWSWERPKEESCIEVVSDEEELGKGKAKAN